MRSTGEVMGIGPDFPTAFGKAERAAGRPLPRTGTAFLSVRDRDKPAATMLAALLQSLGFELVATTGTARALRRIGIPVGSVRKVGDGSPNVVDLLGAGGIQLVINTPGGRGTRVDGYEIRAAAIAHRVPASPPWPVLQRRCSRSRRPRRSSRWRCRICTCTRTPVPPPPRSLSVAAVEAVGAYALLRLRNDGGDVGGARPVLHAPCRPGPGRCVPAARHLGSMGRRRRARLPARRARGRNARAYRRREGVGARPARPRLRTRPRPLHPGRGRHRRRHPAVAAAAASAGRGGTHGARLPHGGPGRMRRPGRP